MQIWKKQAHHCLLVCLSLILAACATTVSLPPDTVQNQTRYKLHLTEVELNIHPGKTFSPVIYAEGMQPPTVTQLKQLKVKQLVDQSLGTALTLHHKTLTRPMHAYLVLYHYADHRYRIRLTAEQEKQISQGNSTLAYGLTEVNGKQVVIWALWIDTKMIDEGCTC